MTIDIAAVRVLASARATTPSFASSSNSVATDYRERFSGAMPFTVAVEGTTVSGAWTALSDQIQTHLPCPNVVRKHNAAGVQGTAARGRPV